MDGLDFSLRGFVVCYLLTYAAGILFAVLEGRRWNAAARTVPPAVVLIVFAPLIFPVVAHLVRPRLRARGVDARIVRLKKEKGAVILAHYYTLPEVQRIADFTGAGRRGTVALRLFLQCGRGCGVLRGAGGLLRAFVRVPQHDFHDLGQRAPRCARGRGAARQMTGA